MTDGQTVGTVSRSRSIPAVWPSGRLAVPLVACLTLAPSLAHAQLTRDVQIHGVAVLASERFVGGGFGFAVRPPGRIRLGGTISAGDLDGSVAGRGEVFVALHLNPGKESGFVPYAAAGLAVLASEVETRGYVQVLLGLEQKPGRRTGFFVEAGIGGGVRLSAGYRFRSGSGIRR